MKRQKRQHDLRRLARGKDCMLRVPGVCIHDPETTVLAHIRRGGVAGVGQKPADLIAVWACAACHDVIDGRGNPGMPRGELDGYVLEALCRQLNEYTREGVVSW